LKTIITQNQVSQFLTKITQSFPNFIAGIITDKHGFPIASKFPNTFPYDENILALEAISRKKSFINHSKYVKVKRTLNKEGSIQLLLILRKPNIHVYAYKDLKNIIERQALF
jgi:hypothetical protein